MATIRGRITSLDGAPIGDASVMVVSGPVHNDIASETDSSGRFELGPLAPGLYHVSVVAAGFVPVTGRVPVRLGRDTRADVTLRYDQVREIEAMEDGFGAMPDGEADDLVGFATGPHQDGRSNRTLSS